MKLMFFINILCLCLQLATSVSATDDAPLFDQKNNQVNQHIFTLEKDGRIKGSEAAAFQLKRSEIVGIYVDKKQRNRGIVPTADVRQLCDRLDSLDRSVTKREQTQSITQLPE